MEKEKPQDLTRERGDTGNVWRKIIFQMITLNLNRKHSLENEFLK